MEVLGIVAIPVITVICYLIAEGVRATKLDNKWLPLLCGCTGAVLGIIAQIVMVDFPATDPLTAVAIGIVSGFAATGIDQVFKQLGGK